MRQWNEHKRQKWAKKCDKNWRKRTDVKEP